MESDAGAPEPAKGYQKKAKPQEKKAEDQEKPKKSYTPPKPSLTVQKWPALVEAIESDKPDAVKQLIDEGVNVNNSRNGITPLMIAASRGLTTVATVILQAGVNVNEKDLEGCTALHRAASDQTGTGIIDLLLQSGADAGARDRFKKTALTMAEEKGHHEIVRILQRHRDKLLADAREWNEFLNSPEGNPYKQRKLLDTLDAYAAFIWAPPVALGLGGLLLGAIFGAALLAGFIGLIAGGLVIAWATRTTQQLRSFFDSIEPLPELDIHLLREKRKNHEPLPAVKRKRPAEKHPAAPVAPAAALPAAAAEALRPSLSTAPDITELEIPAPEAAEPTPPPPAAKSPEIAPPLITAPILTAPAAPSKPAVLSSRHSPAAYHTPVLKQRTVKTSSFPARIDRRLLVITAMLLATVIALSILTVYRDSIVKWYYAMKAEARGLAVSGESFLDAVARNDKDTADLLRKAGVPLDAVNADGRTALMIAVAQGNAGMLDKLLQWHVAPLNAYDKQGSTALMMAARQGREAVVQLLLETGAGVNFTVPSREGPASALQAVIDAPDFKEEHLRVMHTLIERGADVNARNSAGRSPLLFAANSGRTEAAKLLLEHGADINAEDVKGSFPLLSAACKGHTAFVALLVEKGANAGLTLPDGRTPLLCALVEGRLDTVKTLLDRGADPNARTSSGVAALTIAAGMENVAAVRLLLEKGADPGQGYVPGSFLGLAGHTVSLRMTNAGISNILARIAKAASRDGYTITLESPRERKISLKARGPWNKVLRELSEKQHFLLVLKDRKVFLLPYDPAIVKRRPT